MNQSNHDFSNAMPLNNEQKMVALLEEISTTLKALLALSQPKTPYADLLASRTRGDGQETPAPKPIAPPERTPSVKARSK